MGKPIVEGSGGRDSFTEARRVCGRCRKAGGLGRWGISGSCA